MSKEMKAERKELAATMKVANKNFMATAKVFTENCSKETLKELGVQAKTMQASMKQALKLDVKLAPKE